MNDWDSVSQEAREVMKNLGNFGPTVNPARKEVKGYTHYEDACGKTYWGSRDLRNIAAACTEVANWLDARAAAHEQSAPKWDAS
jgi:hypothetical protein